MSYKHPIIDYIDHIIKKIEISGRIAPFQFIVCLLIFTIILPVILIEFIYNIYSYIQEKIEYERRTKCM